MNTNCTKEVDSQTTSGLSGTLTFQDGCGTQTNIFEMKVSGAPATVSVTISGCQRGGTCTALTTSTSTANVQLSVQGGPYDSYQIAFTLTGGTSPTLLFNRTASVWAKSIKATPGLPITGGSGGYAVASPLYVDASAFCPGSLGFNATTGTCKSGNYNTMCQAIQAAGVLAFSLGAGVNANAFQGQQITAPSCGVTEFYYGQTVGSVVNSSVTFDMAMTEACDGAAGGNFTDGASPTPSGVGTPCHIVPPGFSVIGISPRNTDLVLPCTGSNAPVPGCTLTFPTRSLPLTNIAVAGSTMTLTTSTAITGTGGLPTQNIWPQNGGIGGEPIQIVGACLNAYNITRTVLTVVNTPTNTITVNVPSGTSTAGCTSNSGTAYLGTALWGCGVNQVNAPYVPVQWTAGGQGFGCVVTGMAAWGESTQVSVPPNFGGAYGTVLYQNVNQGEQSGFYNDSCQYWAFICLDIRATDSGPYEKIYATNLASGTAFFGTLGALVGAPIRGINSSTFVPTYANTQVNTSNGALGGCTTNCVQWVSGDKFPPSWQNTQVNITGAPCAPSCTVLTWNNNTSFTLSSAPGTLTNVALVTGQPWTGIMVDGPGPTPNSNGAYISNHCEFMVDCYGLLANRSLRGFSALSALSGPSSATGHNIVNLFHIYNNGVNTLQGASIMALAGQSLGQTTIFLDDVNGISCTSTATAFYQTDESGHAMHSCLTGSGLTGANITRVSGGGVDAGNGFTVQGNAVPSEVFNTFQVNLSTNYNGGAAQTIFTPTASTPLRVCVTETSSNVPTGATLPSLTLGWTDPTATAHTVTLLSATSAISTKGAFAANGVNASNALGSGACTDPLNTSAAGIVTVTSAGYAAGSGTALTYDLAIYAVRY